MTPIRNCIRRFDAHHRVALSLFLALIVFVATPSLRLAVRALVAWDAFAFTYLALSWVRIAFADARTSVRDARLQDSSRTALFLFVIVAAVASLFAVGLLLGSAKGLSPSRQAEHALLAGLTVAASWCLTHTVFALRYAHIFYQASDDKPERAQGEGLDFPREKHPDFLDFAYFSFVIGMTCQVSDVQITARRIRRIALLHGLLAFVFNTVILALSINLASAFI
jgi:uncharacterized membrane protein